jgi:acetyltransferase
VIVTLRVGIFVSQIRQNPASAEQTTIEKSKAQGSLVSQFTMKDGTVVTLRPIRADDEPLMKQFHETLSDRTVYMRYFCSLSLRSRVAHERLVRICHADGDRVVALVVDRKDEMTGQHQILAVGRMMRLDSGNKAEIAILVSDQCQRQNLGFELLRQVIQIARDQNLKWVYGELLRDNLAMQVILKKFAFRFRLLPAAPSVTAVLEL